MRTLKVFEYQVQKLGGTASDFPTSGSIVPSPPDLESVYAHAAYGVNVRQFFDDATLLTPWEPSVNGTVPGYFTFKGGIKTLGGCLGNNACYQNIPVPFWNVVAPTPNNAGCPPTQNWGVGDPQNFDRVSIPLFRGKFSASGQLLNGYTIDPSSPYPSNLATSTIRQTVNGSGSTPTAPTNADVAQFPVSRQTGMIGPYCT